MLFLNVFTLFGSLTSSGKPFQIKGPKYDKHFWLKDLVLRGWKSFKEEFLVKVLFWLVFSILFIYWGHISEKNLKCLWNDITWIFGLLQASSSCQHLQFYCGFCCPVVSRNVYICFVKPAICFYIFYLNLDTMPHTDIRSMAG